MAAEPDTVSDGRLALDVEQDGAKLTPLSRHEPGLSALEVWRLSEGDVWLLAAGRSMLQRLETGRARSRRRSRPSVKHTSKAATSILTGGAEYPPSRFTLRQVVEPAGAVGAA